jgi:creatinine amidohydrolase
MGYWEFSTEDTLRKVFPDGFPSWNLEHAGVMETSVMLYLHENSPRSRLSAVSEGIY